MLSLFSLQMSKKISKKKQSGVFELKFIQKKQFQVVLVTLIFLILSVWFAYDVRVGPVSLDGIEKRIESNLNSQIGRLIEQDINAKYPNLNPIEKDILIQRELERAKESGEFNYQGQIINIGELVEGQAAQLKDFLQSDEGQTYLVAIDPYSFFRKASNLAETGSQGDEIIDGVGYETRTLAPSRREASEFPNLHIWLLANVMKLGGVDDGTSTIGEKTSAIFTLPALISVLAVVVAFFFIRKFTSNLFAFFGSIFLGSFRVFLSRTQAGFVDTDAYVVLFSLLILTFMIYSVTSEKNIYKILFGVLTGISFVLFAWAWNYWFSFAFVLISILGYLVYEILKKVFTRNYSLKDDYTKVYGVLSALLTGFIGIWVVFKRNIFLDAYRGAFGSLRGLASIEKDSVWPNVFSSVAELSEVSLKGAIENMGGMVVVIISLLGLLFLTLDFTSKTKVYSYFKIGFSTLSFFWFLLWLKFGDGLSQTNAFLFLVLLFVPVGVALVLRILLSKNVKDENNIVFIPIICSVWFAGTFFMGLNGVRFFLLVAPILSIMFAFGLYYISKYINYLFAKLTNFDKNWQKYLIGFVFASVIFVVIVTPQVKNAYDLTENTTPYFDDSWYSSMKKIREETQENAIITSWWDFGHFFGAVGERGVTFDGGTQSTPQAHWVGRMLVENNVSVSKDILKMLVCSGNGAFDVIQNITDGRVEEVHIIQLLYETFGKNATEKREVLEEFKYYDFSQSEIDLILSELSCLSPRESIVVTSEDMVGKAPVWAHWGLFDVEKKYVYNKYEGGEVDVERVSQLLDVEVEKVQKYVEELKEIERISNSRSQKFEEVVNSWFSPYPSFRGVYNCENRNLSLVCANSELVINTEKLEVENGRNVRRLIFPTILGIRTKELNESGVADVVILSQNQVLLADYPLGNSLFTRLFYLNGHGLENDFEEFDSVFTQTTGRVSVWKTNFNSSLSNVTK